MSNKKKSSITSLSYLPAISQLTFYKTFLAWHHFLKKSATWNTQKIKTYQSKTLQSLITHAYQHVPYYHTVFNKQSIKPKDIKTPKDLKKIPVLTKASIRKHLRQLQATNYPKNAFYPYHTGGTTGQPLLFYIEKARWLGIHFAFNKFYMQTAGYHITDKVISFTGIKKPIQYHPFYRTIELSSFHTTPQDFDLYYDKIHRFKPTFITTFPSAFLLFTNDIIQRNKHIPSTIKAIFCHGELLRTNQKTFLEELYNCRVYDQYGHREQCVFATTCPSSNLYHVYPSYGIVELIDTKQNICSSEGKTGNIIATSLTNRVFPFIRYNTEDKAESTNETCPCANHTTFFKKIIGRTQEYLIGKNHEKIPLTGLYHLCSQQKTPIRECQIIQEQVGELIISYIPTKQLTEKGEKTLYQLFYDVLGDMFSYQLQPVKTIPRTKHGKQRYLIQKLNTDSY